MGKLIVILLLAANVGWSYTLSPYMEMVLRAPNATDARRRLEITNGTGGVSNFYTTNFFTTNTYTTNIANYYGGGWQTNRWTTNADNATINGDTLTNAQGIAAGEHIRVTTNSGRLVTISAGPQVLVELTNGAVTTPWIYTDDIDNDITNILIHYPVPATGLYTVNLAFHTITSNALENIDSYSETYLIWTTPDGFAYTAPAITTTYQTWWNRPSLFAPITVACQGGTSLIVSNYAMDSFYSVDGDTPSTNFIRASVWGKAP